MQRIVVLAMVAIVLLNQLLCQSDDQHLSTRRRQLAGVAAAQMIPIKAKASGLGSGTLNRSISSKTRAAETPAAAAK